MNVGDLLDARVVGPDDEPLGVVVDVRFAIELVDDPDAGAPGADDHEENVPLRETTAARDAVGRARLVGLLVSPRRGSYLGYERTGVTAPWPVAQLVRRRHRGTSLVRWEHVAGVDREGPRRQVVRLARGWARESPELT